MFVHSNPLFEPNYLETNAYINDESQVHASYVSSVESYSMSLGHFYVLLATPAHVHIDDFVALPSISHVMTYIDLS